MRRRLVSHLDRRNRPFADELADETFNRIGRTLETDGAIATTPPARYCYVIARFVPSRISAAAAGPWPSTKGGPPPSSSAASRIPASAKRPCFARSV